MRHIIYFLLFILATSCNSLYYQVVSTSSDDTIEESPSDVYFENNEVRVTYEFWHGDGVYLQYRILNKTENPINILLNESHVIINGISTDFHGAESVTAMQETSQKANLLVENNSTVTHGQSIHLPPNSSRYFTKSIFHGIYTSCDLENPNRGVSQLKFSSETSPLEFRNYITYIANNTKSTIDNKFYVSDIANMSLKEFRGKAIKSRTCNTNFTFVKSYEYPHYSEKRFYLRYRAD